MILVVVVSGAAIGGVVYAAGSGTSERDDLSAQDSFEREATSLSTSSTSTSAVATTSTATTASATPAPTAPAPTPTTGQPADSAPSPTLEVEFGSSWAETGQATSIPFGSYGIVVHNPDPSEGAYGITVRSTIQLGDQVRNGEARLDGIGPGETVAIGSTSEVALTPFELTSVEVTVDTWSAPSFSTPAITAVFLASRPDELYRFTDLRLTLNARYFPLEANMVVIYRRPGGTIIGGDIQSAPCLPPGTSTVQLQGLLGESRTDETVLSTQVYVAQLQGSGEDRESCPYADPYEGDE